MSIFRIIYSAISNTKNISTSIFGTGVPNNNSSELNTRNWSFIKIMTMLSDTLIPTLPIYCPSWIPKHIKRIFFGSNSRYIPDGFEIQNKECFIFVNGIMSDENVVYSNQRLLKEMFKRPINLIHNVSDSLIIDLVECLIGKQTEYLTEPSLIGLQTISQKILNPEISKIVLLCHSQGTIIISKIIDNLYKLGINTEEYLKKIEIYAFANCATKMNYLLNELPYIENFANDNDLIAKLGCNCSEDMKEYIKIDGKLFISKNSYGHMFNSHYMEGFQTKFPESKLNSYICF